MTFKQFLAKTINIFKDCRGSTSGAFAKSRDEKIFSETYLGIYSIQLGLLNDLLKAEKIGENQYRQFKSFLKSKYNIKNSI